MIDAQTAFGHHLLEITQAEIVSEVPTYAQQYHQSVEMVAFAHGKLPKISRDHYRSPVSEEFATEPAPEQAKSDDTVPIRKQV